MEIIIEFDNQNIDTIYNLYIFNRFYQFTYSFNITNKKANSSS